MTSFFSLIIPTYNRAGFIRKAIESALQQTYRHFEIIVVDDGSTDDTEQIVTGMPDSRIIYHKKTNEERAVARNTGAGLAKGDYINFFDSDDLLYENHLAVALETIRQFSNPACFHLGYDVKTPEGDVLNQVNQFRGDLNTRLIHGNVLSCNGVFLRRDIALKHPFNPDRALSASEDYELWLRLASRYPLYYNNTITSTVINHELRSVMVVNKDKLVQRLSLLYEYITRDEPFMQKYGQRKNLFKSDLETYAALHLALTKKHRWTVLKYLTSAVLGYPRVLATRRFYASIKHIF